MKCSGLLLLTDDEVKELAREALVSDIKRVLPANLSDRVVDWDSAIEAVSLASSELQLHRKAKWGSGGGKSPIKEPQYERGN